eukprot:1842800-Karenia_brevis.AAC.1
MRDDEGEPTENDSKTKRASPEQNRARRKLIRLWSAANHALKRGDSYAPPLENLYESDGLVCKRSFTSN